MRRESVQPTHSPRGNIAGSIDSARRTGIHLATSPSKDIARATPVSTSGSRSCLVHETRPVCRLPHKRCVRVREGGEVRETVTVDRGCFRACSAAWTRNVAELAEARTGQVLTFEAPSPHAGWP